MGKRGWGGGVGVVWKLLRGRATSCTSGGFADDVGRA